MSAGAGIAVPSIMTFKYKVGGLSELCHKCVMHVLHILKHEKIQNLTYLINFLQNVSSYRQSVHGKKYEYTINTYNHFLNTFQCHEPLMKYKKTKFLTILSVISVV